MSRQNTIIARMPKRSTSGFTLVEILIVVIILGILAAIILPNFAHASQDAKSANLHSQLQTVRAAIQLYRVQHRDVPPDLVGTSWAAFTEKTDYLGNPSTNPNDWGPYMGDQPRNPLLNSAVISDTAAAGVAWVYNKNSGTIVATSDEAGTLFDESSN